MKTKRYTVVVLLNKDGSKVLLQKKDRTAFVGKWNGVGGKIEDGEEPVAGAYREIEEETSLKPSDIKNLTWLGTLTLPEQCDLDNPDLYPELWFFSGIVEDESLAVKPDTETEEIAWFKILDNKKLVSLPPKAPFNPDLAGDGDLPYFIDSAKRLLFGVVSRYDSEDEE